MYYVYRSDNIARHNNRSVYPVHYYSYFVQGQVWGVASSKFELGVCAMCEV